MNLPVWPKAIRLCCADSEMSRVCGCCKNFHQRFGSNSDDFCSVHHDGAPRHRAIIIANWLGDHQIHWILIQSRIYGQSLIKGWTRKAPKLRSALSPDEAPSSGAEELQTCVATLQMPTRLTNLICLPIKVFESNEMFMVVFHNITEACDKRKPIQIKD